MRRKLAIDSTAHVALHEKGNNSKRRVKNSKTTDELLLFRIYLAYEEAAPSALL
jgi:hypothetical protein